jgi:hypothetical protein
VSDSLRDPQKNELKSTITRKLGTFEGFFSGIMPVLSVNSHLTCQPVTRSTAD